MKDRETLIWGVVVLAAGKGTRMRSDLPKVLHEVAGRPLIDWVLDLALASTAPEGVMVVVGHGADQVRARVAGRDVRTVLQEPQLGTADALRVALEGMADPLPEAVLVLSGDVPLLRRETIERLKTELEEAAAVLLTAELEEPGSYGRVLRDPDGMVGAIVEAGDANPETLAVREVNAGVYAFRRAPLEDALARLAPDNVQGEYYLTDVAAALGEQGLRVAAIRLEDPEEMQGVNTTDDLETIEGLLGDPRQC